MPYAPLTDANRDRATDMTSPASRVISITPHATNEIPEVVRALRFDVGGTVRFIPVANLDSEPVNYTVVAGEILPVRVRRVLVTGTTASGITGLI